MSEKKIESFVNSLTNLALEGHDPGLLRESIESAVMGFIAASPTAPLDREAIRNEAMEEAANAAFNAPITANMLDSDDAKAVALHAASRIRHLKSQPAQAANEEKWRDLALQFDEHRMQAIGWLKVCADKLPERSAEVIKEFLKAPPLPGQKVLADRIASMCPPAQPSDTVRPIGKIVIRPDGHPYALLSTGYDKNGNQWKDGTAIYAETDTSIAQPSDSQAEPSDTEMLDWVLENNVRVFMDSTRMYVACSMKIKGGRGVTMREAIKVAMSENKESE